MTGTGSLAGCRILIVEDEYYIAADLARTLAQGAATVIGPAGDLATGLGLIEGAAIDAAILDINLGGRTSFALALALSGRQIPFIFVTGYDEWTLPPRFRAVPRVTKPYLPSAVVDLIAGLCNRTHPR